MTKRRSAKMLANLNKKAKVNAEENMKNEEVLNEEAVEEEEESAEEEEPFPLKELGPDMMNCVLEKLKVKDTMTLMATSKSMKLFYESKPKFKIPFEFFELQITTRESGLISLIQRNGQYPYRHFGSRLLKKKDPLLSDLQALPFRFGFNHLFISNKIVPAVGDALVERLDMLKIEFIKTAHIGSKISLDEVEILERSLANVVIGKLSLLKADPSILALPFIRKYPLEIGLADGSLNEHMSVIQNAKLRFDKVKEESKTEIEAAVETVIEKWSSTPCALKEWKLRFTSNGDMKTYEAFQAALDSRFPIDVNSRGQIPNQRPLFFIRKEPNIATNQYYIVRQDNTLVHIYFDSEGLNHHMVFKLVVPV